MTQHRFAVPSTYTRIWFVNRSKAVREPFGALVYTSVNTPSSHREIQRYHTKIKVNALAALVSIAFFKDKVPG